MSLEAYDVALTDLIKGVYPNTVFASQPQALKVSAKTESVTENTDGEIEFNDQHSQVVAFPLISIDRVNQEISFFEQQRNDPTTRRGRAEFIDEEPYRQKAFPVRLNYQIDIYSDRRVEVDGIWRELVMFLYEQGKLSVNFDFNGSKFVEAFVMHLTDTDVTTDVEEFVERGRIYRITTNLEIPDAKLFFLESINLIDAFPVRVLALDHPEPGSPTTYQYWED